LQLPPTCSALPSTCSLGIAEELADGLLPAPIIYFPAPQFVLVHITCFPLVPVSNSPAGRRKRSSLGGLFPPFGFFASRLHCCDLWPCVLLGVSYGVASARYSSAWPVAEVLTGTGGGMAGTNNGAAPIGEKGKAIERSVRMMMILPRLQARPRRRTGINANRATG
jgi:hypothetical protein